MIRGLQWLAVAIAVCGSGSLALGQDESVSVRWTSTDGCLSTEVLRGSVAKAASRNRVVAAGASVVIVGKAERASEASWSVVLVVRDRFDVEVGRRAFSVAGSGCTSLVDHVVLVTTMLVDSALVSTASEATSKAAMAPPKADRQNPLEAPLRRKPERLRRGILSVALGPVAEFGRLPSQSFGGSLSLAVTLASDWRISIRGLAFPEVEAVDVEGRGTLSWQTLGLLGCPPPWSAAGFVMGACLGMEAGVVNARGQGFQLNRVQHELLLDAEGELWTRLDLSKRLFLRANVIIRGALVRPTLGYTSASGSFQTLYTPSLIGASSEIALGVTFL